MSISFFILLGLMFGALAMVVLGLVVMIAGGKVNEKYSTKIMVARVAFQALALLALVVLFAAKKTGAGA